MNQRLNTVAGFRFTVRRFAIQAAAPADTPTPDPLPGHLYLYILAAGVLLGVLLGPGVLGNLWPEGYAAVVGLEMPDLAAFDAETGRQLDALVGTGVTREAVEELQADRQLIRSLNIQAANDASDDDVMGMIWALFLAAIAIIIFEALFSPHLDEAGLPVFRPVYRRLILVRTALFALMITLFIARPTILLKYGSVGMFIAAFAPALLISLIPFGSKRKN